MAAGLPIYNSGLSSGSCVPLRFFHCFQMDATQMLQHCRNNNPCHADYDYVGVVTSYGNVPDMPVPSRSTACTRKCSVSAAMLRKKKPIPAP